MQVKYESIKDSTNIIDIRDHFSFEKFNIPGSINVSRIKLLSNPDLYMNLFDSYYLICDKGYLSLSCAKILNALGYNCFSVIGGIEYIKKLNFY